MELAEKERFPDSKPAGEKPFTMSKENRVIRVRLTYLAEGWNLDNTDATQVKCNFYLKKNSHQYEDSQRAGTAHY